MVGNTNFTQAIDEKDLLHWPKKVAWLALKRIKELRKACAPFSSKQARHESPEYVITTAILGQSQQFLSAYRFLTVGN